VTSLRARLTLFSVLFCSSVLAFSQAPTIASVAPNAGVVGTQVTITGTNFGAAQGTSAVTFNGTAATTFTSWSATSTVTAVPTGTTTGRVVVTVAGVASNSVNFTVVPGSFSLTGNLATARMFQTATLLNSGMVLVAGGVDGFAYGTITSAELYNPATATFTTTGSLNTGRIFNTATLLANGQVLVAGGSDSNWNQIGTAELYDPASGTFTFTGSLNTARTAHTATVLNNGKVLIAGGWNSNGDYITSDAGGGELYDPKSRTFASTSNLNTARDTHTATLLNDGTVLIAGGFDSNANPLSSAEIYDPVAGTFTLTGSLNIGRAVHTATLLNNGMVLIAGGYDFNGNAVASAELYNPTTRSFTATGSLNTPRYDGAQGTLLNNGMVLLAGGQDNNGNTLASAELYDPATGNFTATANMNTTRQSLTTTLLNNGQVLVAAGMDFYANVLNSAELYQPSTLTPAGLVSIAVSPSSPSVSVGATQFFTATGTFSDNSTQTLDSVTWSSSDSTIGAIANDPSDRGNAVAVAPGSVTVSACTGSLCGSTTMTVLGPPSITSLSPSSGAVGTLVTITGTNFGSTEGSSTLTFNGTVATTILSWSPTSIVAIVPAGAITGNVVVTVGGVASSGFAFMVIPTSPLNIGRYQHSATLLNNGTVLVAGGAICSTAGSCTYLSSAEIYNSASGISSGTGSLATPRVAPAVLLPSGKVLVAGGSTCDPYGNCYSLNSAEIYDPIAGAFSSAGNLQAARDGHTMTLLADGRVLIAGGESCIPGGGSSGGGPSSKNLGEPLLGEAHLVYASFAPVPNSVSCTAEASAEIYDPETGAFSLTGPLNTARYNAAGTRLANGQVLIVGGSNESTPLNSAELYDPPTSSFTVTASGLGTARSSPAATLLNNGLVLITGGSTCEGPTCPTNTAELYDPTANAFHYTSGNMNASRVNHAAALLTNGQVLLAGGTNACSGATACTSDGTTELYDPIAGTFTSSQGLVTARSGHTGTLLPNGNVLLAGGIAAGTTLSSVEFYQPASVIPGGLVSIAVAPSSASIPVDGIQQFVAIGTFSDGSTSTLESVAWISSSPSVAVINDAAGSSGLTLGVSLGSTNITATVGTLSGSATLTVQPPVQSIGFTTTTGQIGASLYAQTATRLISGQVLIAGGMSPSGAVNNAELYNPANQSFVATSPMNVARWLHTATLLNDGTILIAGGSDSSNKETLDTAEIYNPATSTFTLLSNTLNTARIGHTATLLANGRVLIVGGDDPALGLIADAELYDPPTQTFIDLGDTLVPRFRHSATILQNGQVLIAGGETDPTPGGAYNTAELFDPISQTFTLVSVPMTASREGHSAVLMNNGRVLITGGNDPGAGPLNSAELYDPTSDIFIAVTGTMTTPRISPAMTLLNGGQVLIVGGASGPGGPALASTENYNPANQLFTAAGSMASVRESHTDTLLNDGTILITGGTDGTNIFNSAELYMASQLNGLTSIAVTPATPSVGMGGQQFFTAMGTFSNGNSESLASVLWSSSNTGVATASNDATDSGFAASLTQGTATITASALGITGSSSLTITAPTLVSIQLSPLSPTIPLGSNQQFTATGVYTDGSTQDLTSTATWSASASVVATVNSSGLAVGLFQGVSTIQVSSGSVSTTTNLNVGSAGLVSITVTPASATIPLGSTQQYQAIGTYSDGSTQNVSGLVSWSAVSTSVATISGTGLALGVSQGSTTITANFESISITVQLAVGPPSLLSLAITPNGSMFTGAARQLTATGNYTDGSTQNLTSSSLWTSSNPGVLSVSSSGLATTASVGEATITATTGTTSGTAVFIVTSGTTQANLNTSRYLHSATAMYTGQVLVAGGVNCPSAGSCRYLNSAELYNPAGSTFTNTGAMTQARSAPAVLLNNGNVLIAGGYFCDTSANCSSLSSAEIYNPSAGTFSSAGNMTVARSGHTMTLLGNGTVLLAGGQTCTTATSCTTLSSAEIYDPVAGTFKTTSTGMSAARFGAAAVTLNSGLVLIVGGFDGTNLPAAAEVYSPTQQAFTFNGPKLNASRFNATATLLNNGKVLVAGGSTCALPGCPSSAAEIYDPVANTFTVVAGGMSVPRFDHTATLLTNGQVFVAGGFSSCSSSCTSEASTELFDPVAGVFSSSQALTNALAGQSATLTANGNALLIGGISGGVTSASDEWYQPTTLAPPGLVSIAVTPANSFLVPGQTQQMLATGTFSDGSTQSLQSVIWTSSNTSAAAVNNSPGSAGVVSAQATGAATITATAGNVGGSVSVNVESLVSLAIVPANPSIALGAGQQLAASGTFTDNSVHDLTASVTWSSSNPSTVFVGSTGMMLAGFAMGANPGTATITASLGNSQATSSVTVEPAPVTPNPPNIIIVSPSSGAGGTSVTISGSGFGSVQGSGTIWLGSTFATVMSWSDTQIVATVAAISQSGTVQVRQSGLSSNSVPFSVSATTIFSVSPSSGVPGTQVAIYGSGFGPTQGGGQVWLGTANAIVQSWSDTQIVASVALGSTSGSARVLQNGIISNPFPFAVNTLQLTGVTPNSGVPGTVVTITGNGFGNSQGSGAIWLGSAAAEVIGWSNTQILAVVASNAVSGVARIEQNGTWSNAVPFTVPVQLGGGGGGDQSVTLAPGMVSLVVGQTQSILALNASGQSVTGLTWRSSNPQVVSLSADDPPILTAITTGHASITAGNGSADVTVYPGLTLPLGTTIWSNPGDGSGVISIVPAVPSDTGVADVFALNYDCTVQAIASDGTVAWQANIGTSTTLNLNTNGNTTTTACNQFYPDFQGGLVVMSQSSSQGASGLTTTAYVQKFDGMTGVASPPYNLSSPAFDQTPPTVLHTSAVIFTLDGGTVVGIDPASGSPKFQVQAEQSTLVTSGTNCVQGDGTLLNPNFIKSINSSFTGPASWLSAPIVAGDGNLYVAYSYYEETATAEAGPPDENSGQPCTYMVGSSSGVTNTHYRVLRVGPEGDSSKIVITDFTSTGSSYHDGSGALISIASETGFQALSVGGLITNADQGVTLSWSEGINPYASYEYIGATGTQQTTIPGTFMRKITAMNAGGITSDAIISEQTNVQPGPGYTPPDPPFVPILQRQDGSYMGTFPTNVQVGIFSCVQTNMIAFNLAGAQLWIKPNYTPQIATADNGVIANPVPLSPQPFCGGGGGGGGSSVAVTFDPNGNQTGQTLSNGDSWTGNSYAITGDPVVASLNLPYTDYAINFQATPLGNLSTKGTSVPPGPVVKTFMPFQVFTSGLTDSQYVLGLQTAIPITKADLNFYRKPKATLAEFQKQLAKRVDAIALISHGNVANNTIAVGLCFDPPANAASGITLNCTVTSQYSNATAQGVTMTEVNSFSTQAKIVFLAACDAAQNNFTSLWNITRATKGQALIIQDVSKYNGRVNLAHAAVAWQAILGQLGLIPNAQQQTGVQGMTVAKAVAAANNNMTANQYSERWTWIGDGSVTIAHK